MTPYDKAILKTFAPLAVIMLVKWTLIVTLNNIGRRLSK